MPGIQAEHQMATYSHISSEMLTIRIAIGVGGMQTLHLSEGRGQTKFPLSALMPVNCTSLCTRQDSPLVGHITCGAHVQPPQYRLAVQGRSNLLGAVQRSNHFAWISVQCKVTRLTYTTSMQQPVAKSTVQRDTSPNCIKPGSNWMQVVLLCKFNP
jgi:hypothetical protein